MSDELALHPRADPGSRVRRVHAAWLWRDQHGADRAPRPGIEARPVRQFRQQTGDAGRLRGRTGGTDAATARRCRPRPIGTACGGPESNSARHGARSSAGPRYWRPIASRSWKRRMLRTSRSCWIGTGARGNTRGTDRSADGGARAGSSGPGRARRNGGAVSGRSHGRRHAGPDADAGGGAARPRRRRDTGPSWRPRCLLRLHGAWVPGGAGRTRISG